MRGLGLDVMGVEDIEGNMRYKMSMICDPI